MTTTTKVSLLPAANTSTSTKQRVYPLPKAGRRPARVSVILDLGVHERPLSKEEIEKGYTAKAPCKQVAIAVDLVRDVVDYGEGIGQKPYRHYLVRYSKEEGVKGINLLSSPLNEERTVWGWHPKNQLTALAKAGNIEERNDVATLLNMPFRIGIKLTQGANGNTYANTDGFTPPNEDDDTGLPEVIPELPEPAQIITFETATAEQVKHIRRDLIRKIVAANNYEGSQMQQALEECFGNELFKIAPLAMKSGAAEAAAAVDAKVEPAPLPSHMTKQAAPVEQPKDGETPSGGEDMDEDDDIPF